MRGSWSGGRGVGSRMLSIIGHLVCCRTLAQLALQRPFVAISEHIEPGPGKQRLQPRENALFFFSEVCEHCPVQFAKCFFPLWGVDLLFSERKAIKEAERAVDLRMCLFGPAQHRK